MDESIPTIDVAGAALGATVFSVVVTPVLALLVILLFRRSVARSMRTGAPSHPGAATADRSPVPLPYRPPGSSPRLGVLAGRQLRQAATWYAGAGLAYACATTAILLTVNGVEWEWLRVVVLTVVFAWPIVPTAALVCAWSRTTTGVVVLTYLGCLLGLGALSTGDVLAPLAAWALYQLPASAIVLAVAARPLRGVGPFIAPAVLIVGIGWWIWPWIALLVFSAGTSLDVALVVTVGVIGLAAVAVLLRIPVAAARYRRKAVGDQSVLVDQWWFLFALGQCLLTAGPGWSALAMLAPYLVYRFVVQIGRRGAYRQAVRHRPTRLLLLRVFGNRGRSERLLGQISAYWRYVGSVELIAGTDLASAALEPHELLAFLTRRFTRQFVSGPADLRRRIARLDLSPDRDGRFRINEFFCHDDTWRPTLQTLARTADVILIDLRDLTWHNAGVAYELDLLARFGLLDRVVALADRTTDRAFLHRVLAGAGAPPRLRIVEIQGHRVDSGRLLTEIDAAFGGRVGAGPASRT